MLLITSVILNFRFLDSSYTYVNPGDSHPRKINWLNVVASIEVRLGISAVAVQCHAPVWNSTDYKNVTKRFATKRKYFAFHK